MTTILLVISFKKLLLEILIGYSGNTLLYAAYFGKSMLYFNHIHCYPHFRPSFCLSNNPFPDYSEKNVLNPTTQ